MDITTDGATLVLSGYFDGRSTAQVRDAIYERLYAHDSDVVIDLSLVDSVDVTALKVLAAATRNAERVGHHVRLRGCQPTVRRLLHLSRLARAVEVERAAAPA
ncbi:STAS domain-containing protein [Nocardioides ferulae]|uniref:STAS domain-containing protein n=1 Tax=Nocardioides ferulae TaxID=2340821 RepID=UPI000EB01260|nr:STAS domain-containing protein [Nocardioides ferulae]